MDTALPSYLQVVSGLPPVGYWSPHLPHAHFRVSDDEFWQLLAKVQNSEHAAEAQDLVERLLQAATEFDVHSLAIHGSILQPQGRLAGSGIVLVVGERYLEVMSANSSLIRDSIEEFNITGRVKRTSHSFNDERFALRELLDLMFCAAKYEDVNVDIFSVVTQKQRIRRKIIEWSREGPIVEVKSTRALTGGRTPRR
jgi:hypothetical protein